MTHDPAADPAQDRDPDDGDTLCDRCGRWDQEHSFAELMHCLYAEAGLSREQADGIVDRMTAEVADEVADD
jgi:hypothetical protein